MIAFAPRRRSRGGLAESSPPGEAPIPAYVLSRSTSSVGCPLCITPATKCARGRPFFKISHGMDIHEPTLVWADVIRASDRCGKWLFFVFPFVQIDTFAHWDVGNHTMVITGWDMRDRR